MAGFISILVRAGVRTISRPLASGLRKGADLHPRFRQFIAKKAQRNQTSEVKVIETAADLFVFSMMAGSALMYYLRQSSQQKKKIHEELVEAMRQSHQDLGEELQKRDKELRAELVKELCAELEELRAELLEELRVEQRELQKNAKQQGD